MARSVWQLVRQTAVEFSGDNATRLGAALAFYTALSLAPLLLLVISIAGAVFDQGEARHALVGQMKELIGPEGAKTIEGMLDNSTPRKGGWWAGIVGVVTLLIGATGVFAQLQDSLNAIWKVKGKQTASGYWSAIRDRLLSFSMVCGMAFLLLVSLALGSFLTGVSGMLGRWMPGAVEALKWGNVALSAVVTFAMFAMIFKVLPHARPAWSDVWVGAGITTVLFAVGKYLIGLYLGKAAPGSTFGAAGSFVVLLFWLYYSSLILLFGAEFTQVYATRNGSATEGVAVDGAKPEAGKTAPAGAKTPAAETAKA